MSAPDDLTAAAGAPPLRVAFTTNEVAAMTGLTRRQVIRLCEARTLRAVRAGHYWLIPRAALDEFLEGRPS